jgi:hypothetical protein
LRTVRHGLPGYDPAHQARSTPDRALPGSGTPNASSGGQRAVSVSANGTE